MTKQKIVIKVQSSGVYCDKCRKNALKIAVKAKGVSLASVEGENGDHVVVIGEEVDSIGLGRALRKKFGYAEIISVEQVMEQNDVAVPNSREDGNNDQNEDNEEEQETTNPMELPPSPSYCPGHHYHATCVIYESYDDSDYCIIM